jgi:hypothetical protein
MVQSSFVVGGRSAASTRRLVGEVIEWIAVPDAAVP